VNVRVNLTKRVRTAEGYRYLPAAVSANGRIKPEWVLVDGKEQRFPDGTYYLDYTDSTGKRIRSSVGKIAIEAQVSRLRKEAELRAIAHGLDVVSGDGEEGLTKRPIALAVAEFLEDVQLTKDPKTYRGYDVALSYFRESCPKVHLESIDRKDLLKFTAFLKKEKKQSPRSVHNKFACLLTFLAANGVPKLVAKSDRPKFVKQEVEIYEHGELDRLFAVCSPYHLMLYKFLLMTGL